MGGIPLFSSTQRPGPSLDGVCPKGRDAVPVQRREETHRDARLLGQLQTTTPLPTHGDPAIEKIHLFSVK